MSDGVSGEQTWQCPNCGASHSDARAGFPDGAPPDEKEWCLDCEGLDVDRQCGDSHHLPCEIDVECELTDGGEADV